MQLLKNWMEISLLAAHFKKLLLNLDGTKMKGPKEYKNWLNRLRRKYGKKNGGIPTCLFDAPEMERKVDNDKKNDKHNRKIDMDN